MLEKGYTLIPKIVLLDKRLTDKQKLLYGEISSLSASEGFCFAGNQHFVDLGYAQNGATITRNIKILEQLGYLNIKLVKGKDSTIRYIYLGKPVELSNGLESQRGIDSGVNYNIYNNIYSLIKEKKLKSKEAIEIVNLLSPYMEEEKEKRVDLDTANLGVFGKVIADYIKDNSYFQEKVTINEEYIDKQVAVILSLGDRFEWLQRDFNGNIPELKIKIILTELDKLFNWYTDNKRPIKNLSGVLRNWFSKVFIK